MVGILPAIVGSFSVGGGVNEHGARDRAVILDADDRFQVVDLKCVTFLGNWKGWGPSNPSIAGAGATRTRKAARS